MIKAINLQAEYLINPLGIDITHPRLFWNVENAVLQNAYQIITETDGSVIWDSGKVSSAKMTGIEYPLSLASRQRVCWRVKLWDENGNEGGWSETAFFEMGLLSTSDWKARWISGNYNVNTKLRYPTDHFRKEFTIKEISHCRIYASACGMYTLKLNGKPVSDWVCAPGHTDYRKRVQYQTYDATKLLRYGTNVLTAELADGWYRGAQGSWGHTYVYGRDTKLLIQIEITDTHNNEQTIISDESWSWSNDGTRRFADLKEGEYVEAWREPSYSGLARVGEYKGQLCCSNNVAVNRHECFKPTMITTPSGKQVLDFGQNLSGFIGFRLKAKKGQKLFLRMGELLDAHGEFTQKNIQLTMEKKGVLHTRIIWKDGNVCNLGQFSKGKITPLQMLEYEAKEGENCYESQFALYGFRYALVETDIPYDAADFYSVAVYSNLTQTGFFNSSNDLLNSFVHCTLWSEKSNSTDVPTDCPTRERSGWTGDAQIFFGTASYLTHYQPFARKFIRDMTDRQDKSGKFHQIVPKGGEDRWMTNMNGSVGWADAGVLIPYRMWKKYGDENIIRDNYEAMKRYAEFMMRRCGGWSLLQKPVRLSAENRKYLVNRGQSYGEWAEPDDVCALNIKNFIFPHPEESTAYTCYVMEHMAEVAEFLEKNSDARVYKTYVDGCRKAYQELVRKPGFSLNTDRQAKLVRPLKMNLLTQEQKSFAKGRLLQAMEHYGWRLGTGFLSTPFILDVLTEINIEYAYRLLENEEMPGWLFMPKNGATTIWEAWEGNTTVSTGIASLNHYSKGAVCEWLFSTACGIQVSGENHFRIAPRPGGRLRFVDGMYNSIYGEVKSSWKKDKSTVTYAITVPANTTAEICLQKGKAFTVDAGTYEFEEECK